MFSFFIFLFLFLFLFVLHTVASSSFWLFHHSRRDYKCNYNEFFKAHLVSTKLARSQSRCLLTNPNSIELGLSQVVMPWLWLWCHSSGRIVWASVCSCCQYANERSLHIVWYFWNTTQEVALFSSFDYEVLSRILQLFGLSNLWKVM